MAKKKKSEMRKRFLFKFRINPASIKLDIKLLNYWFLWRIIRHPDVITKGITNRCEDRANYVTFMDFDNIFYNDLRLNLKAWQKENKTSHIIILTTGEHTTDEGELVGSYHAYELTKRKFYDITPLLRQLPVDPNSLRVPRLFSGKAWVLRTEEKIKEKDGEIIKNKPKFKEILRSRYKQKNKQSFAHYYYLRRQFGIPYFKSNWDKSTKIQKIQYTTTSRRWKTKWFRVSI